MEIIENLLVEQRLGVYSDGLEGVVKTGVVGIGDFVECDCKPLTRYF
jgi:hypothetical protein